MLRVYCTVWLRTPRPELSCYRIGREAGLPPARGHRRLTLQPAPCGSAASGRSWQQAARIECLPSSWTWCPVRYACTTRQPGALKQLQPEPSQNLRPVHVVRVRPLGMAGGRPKQSSAVRSLRHSVSCRRRHHSRDARLGGAVRQSQVSASAGVRPGASSSTVMPTDPEGHTAVSPHSCAHWTVVMPQQLTSGLL